jgi:hypothetical protein
MNWPRSGPAAARGGKSQRRNMVAAHARTALDDHADVDGGSGDAGVRRDGGDAGDGDEAGRRCGSTSLLSSSSSSMSSSSPFPSLSESCTGGRSLVGSTSFTGRGGQAMVGGSTSMTWSKSGPAVARGGKPQRRNIVAAHARTALDDHADVDGGSGDAGVRRDCGDVDDGDEAGRLGGSASLSSSSSSMSPSSLSYTGGRLSAGSSSTGCGGQVSVGGSSSMGRSKDGPITGRSRPQQRKGR